MKTWQVIVLIYLVTAVVGVEFGVLRTPLWVDAFGAFVITLLGLAVIRRLRKSQNPNK